MTLPTCRISCCCFDVSRVQNSFSSKWNARCSRDFDSASRCLWCSRVPPGKASSNSATVGPGGSQKRPVLSTHVFAHSTLLTGLGAIPIGEPCLQDSSLCLLSEAPHKALSVPLVAISEHRAPASPPRFRDGSVCRPESLDRIRRHNVTLKTVMGESRDYGRTRVASDGDLANEPNC